MGVCYLSNNPNKMGQVAGRGIRMYPNVGKTVGVKVQLISNCWWDAKIYHHFHYQQEFICYLSGVLYVLAGPLTGSCSLRWPRCWLVELDICLADGVRHSTIGSDGIFDL